MILCQLYLCITQLVSGVCVCKCTQRGCGWSEWVTADCASRPDSLNNQSIQPTATTKQLATNQLPMPAWGRFFAATIDCGLFSHHDDCCKLLNFLSPSLLFKCTSQTCSIYSPQNRFCFVCLTLCDSDVISHGCQNGRNHHG